jgi:hypothetical protein
VERLLPAKRRKSHSGYKNAGEKSGKLDANRRK